MIYRLLELQVTLSVENYSVRDVEVDVSLCLAVYECYFQNLTGHPEAREMIIQARLQCLFFKALTQLLHSGISAIITTTRPHDRMVLQCGIIFG